MNFKSFTLRKNFNSTHSYFFRYIHDAPVERDFDLTLWWSKKGCRHFRLLHLNTCPYLLHPLLLVNMNGYEKSSDNIL